LEKFFIIGAVNCRGKKEGSSATDSLSEDVTEVTEVRKFGNEQCNGCNGGQEEGIDRREKVQLRTS
jgi:hypothetical protein